MTHLPFFPLNTLEQVMDRKALMLAEFKTYWPDSAPIYELLHLSEVAFTQREARRKAVKDGHVFHG